MKRRFSFRRGISTWLRTPLSGPAFRLYAPRRHWETKTQAPAQPPVTRLLIANLMPSLGDTICYLPLLDVLHEAHPEIEISWLADEPMASLVSMHPAVKNVYAIRVDPSPLLRFPTIKTYYKLSEMMRSLQRMPIENPFDIALVPRGGVDPSFSAHAVWMLNVPRSIGYSHWVEPEDHDHNAGDCLLSEALPAITEAHESMRAIHLLRVAGLVQAPETYWDSSRPITGLVQIARNQNRDDILALLGVPANSRFVVISPGAGLPKKTWSRSKFRELCRRILAQTDLRIIVAGSPGEAALCQSVVDGLGERATNSAGKLNLRELAGLLSLSKGFVGNDSGTGHVAGALGIKTISLHVQPKTADRNHISAPEHYKPVGPNVTVLQPADFLEPCRNRCEAFQVHCLDQITVDDVWSAFHAAILHQPDAALR